MPLRAWRSCVHNFQADLKKLRTGRAHTSPHRAPEGGLLRLGGARCSRVASIAVEEGRTLVVIFPVGRRAPWQAIEKAIFKSISGSRPHDRPAPVIRIPMPPLTEERRRGDHQGAAATTRKNARVRGAQRAPRMS